MEIFREAEEYLKEKREKLMAEWGMDPVPDEPIHTPDSKEYQPGNLLYNFTPVVLYGMTKWSDLYNPRQKLALITLIEKTKNIENIVNKQDDKDYIKAVVSYLALSITMTAAFTNKLARWENTSEAIKQLYSRQALPILWDHAEVNPFSTSSGSIETGWEYYYKVIEHCAHSNTAPTSISQSSATSLLYPDNYFDAVFTDPPYYDNVPYSDLSDFFYIWFKRTIGDLYPELFSTPSTPKSGEIIAELPLLRGMNKEKANKAVHGIKTKKNYESMLKKSFQEMYRVLKPDGIAIIVYAHKSTEGWETLINSLLDSGLIITGAWPLHTEMEARLRAKESAALASSIYIIARKMKREPTGYYHEVREELKKYLNKKLERLWQEGIGGADFFIAAIGSAIEIFGKYEKVMDYEGNIVRADRLLQDVRKIATDYAVRQILHNGFAGEISDLTRFYVLFRWNFGSAKVKFDEARKLAQSCSIDLAKEWGRGGFVKKEKEFISILGPQEWNLEDVQKSSELIDVLHTVLLFWEKSRRSEIINLLKDSGYGKSEAFYRVAQAISETLPNENKEKKLLDGFLAGKERLKEDIKEEITQGRLFK
jgi:adenine-specific DNA methylase